MDTAPEKNTWTYEQLLKMPWIENRINWLLGEANRASESLSIASTDAEMKAAQQIFESSVDRVMAIRWAVQMLDRALAAKRES